MTSKRSQQIEKQLQKLRRDYESLKAEVGELGCILSGSLQKREYKCGKPNCHCATEGILHGPYYQWTRKINGKTVNINLEREMATIVNEWIKNNRRLRRICDRLERTSLAILRTMAKLDGPKSA